MLWVVQECTQVFTAIHRIFTFVKKGCFINELSILRRQERLLKSHGQLQNPSAFNFTKQTLKSVSTVA